MISHIVVWKLKQEAQGHTKAENISIIKEKLESLVGEIEGLKKLEVGINYNPAGYDLSLYSAFCTKEGLDFYQKHPKHIAVREYILKCVEESAVVDSFIS